MLAYRVKFAVGWLALLFAHIAVIHAAPASSHGYGTKSFAQAYLECLNYLKISRQSLYKYNSTAVPLNSGGNCLLRCIGLNTRWWNDETGLNERVLLRYFRQADENSLQQARSCMVEMPTYGDTCAAAYQSFRCYSDVLGEVIAHPEYVAPCRPEIKRAVSDCAKMLQVSDDQLTSCVASETFLRDGNASALLRCVVLRLGLYADSTGVMCDRVQLLMDADTAEQWTVKRVEEAKKCEEDLRALGGESCVVAAHAVEICYGWMAFGELWQALKEEYGSSNEFEFVNENGTELPAISSSTNEHQEMPENNLPVSEQDVEVFKHPPSPRFRGLVIVAPELYAVDAIIDENSSKSMEDSSSQEEDNNPPKNGEAEQLQYSETTVEASTTEDHAVTEVTTTKPQATLEKRTEAAHTILKRSLEHSMVHDQCSYGCTGPFSYVSRITRSAMPHYHHYHPEVVPMINPSCFYPMTNPIVKRSIPLHPMFVPAYSHVAPIRIVREVDPFVVDMVMVDGPTPSTATSSVVAPYADVDRTEHEEIEPMFDMDTEKNVEVPINNEILLAPSEDEIDEAIDVESVTIPENDQAMKCFDLSSLDSDGFQAQGEDSESATMQAPSTSDTDDSLISKVLMKRLTETSTANIAQFENAEESNLAETFTVVASKASDSYDDTVAQAKSYNALPEDSEQSVPSEFSSVLEAEETKKLDTLQNDVSEAKMDTSYPDHEKESHSEISDAPTTQPPNKLDTPNEDLAQPNISDAQPVAVEKLVQTNDGRSSAPDDQRSSQLFEEVLTQPEVTSSEPESNETSTPFRGSSTVATEATSTGSNENYPSVSKKAIHPNTLLRLVRALRETNFIDTILSAINVHQSKQ